MGLMCCRVCKDRAIAKLEQGAVHLGQKSLLYHSARLSIHSKPPLESRVMYPLANPTHTLLCLLARRALAGMNQMDSETIPLNIAGGGGTITIKTKHEHH